MTTPSNARPIRLSRRSGQGVIVGFDGWNMTVMAVAGAILVISTTSYGFFAALLSAPLWLPIGIVGALQAQGMALPRLITLWLMKQVRHATGGSKTRFRPERPKVVGTLELPGGRTSIQIWQLGDFAAIYDPILKTVSITAELEVEGFLMLNMDERQDLSEQWASVLSSFTQRNGVTRVALQERTTPTTIEAARRFYSEEVSRRGTDESSPLAQNYVNVMDRSEEYAVAHRNYLTLTYSLLSLRKQVSSLGGGKAGIAALANVEAKNVAAALTAARIHVRKWLTDRDLAALVRTAMDPAYVPVVQGRHGNNEGVSLDAIGAMAFEEPRKNNAVVKSDSGWHTTMWIHEWPRSVAAIGFVEPIVFARHPVSNVAVSHIFTIVATPVKTTAALKRIKSEKKLWRANQTLKAKRNEHDNSSDTADWDALHSQEDSIVQGHGEFRYGGYLTVTGRDEEDLESAMAGMRNSLARTGMEAQVLYCQQAEAFLVNALPIGWGMK